MPKKTKINKQLDKLFKDFHPEDSASKSKSSPKVENKAAHPADLKPAQKKAEAVSTPRQVKRHTSTLISAEPVITQENENTRSSYSVNIQSSYQDWSTLRIVDETNQRQWTADEELLVKQVSDQLSLALENAHLFQETQKRAGELATLNQIVQAISEEIELKAVLKAAYEEISKIIPMDAFFVALYDATSKMVSYPIVIDEGNYFEEPDSPLDPESFSGKTIISGKLLFETVKPEDAVRNTTDSSTVGNAGKSYGTLLFLPLRSGAKTIGCISIQSYQFFAYKQEDVSLLENIANQISIGIQNAQLYNESKRTNEELAVLNALSAELANFSDVKSVSESVFKYASQLMDTKSFFLCLLDEDKQEISYPLFVGDGEKYEIPTRKPANGLSDYVMRENQSLLLSDHPIERMQELGIDVVLVGNSLPPKSWLGVPLSIGNRTLGAIAVQSTHEEHLYNLHHRELLIPIAQQAAVALENAHLYQDAQERAKELNTLNEMGLALSAETNLQEICEIAYQYTSKLIDTTNYFIAIYEEKTGEIRFPIIVNDNQRIQNAPRRIGGGGLTDHVIRNKEILFIPENVTEYMKRIGLEFITLGNDKPALSWLGVPLLIGNRAVGAMVVQSVEQSNLYTKQERDLLVSVSGQVATALENARLFEETQRRAVEMSALAQIGRDISSTLNIEKVLDKIVLSTLEILRCTSTAVYLPDESFKVLQPVATAGEEAEEIKNDTLDIGTGIIGNIALTKTGEINNNVTNDPRAINIKNTEIIEDEHLMAVPILSQETLRGVLAVWRTGVGQEFIDSEFAFLSSLAQQVATSIDNARLFQEARKFKLGIDRTDNAVFITDPNGVIQYTNPGFEKVYGYKNEEALGKTPRIIKSGIIPDEQYKNFWGTLLSGGTISGELINKTKDGRIIPIAGTNSPILDENGKVLGFLAVHQDISERKLAEESIRRRNEYLAASSEIGKIVTSTLDLNSIFARTVTLINERFNFYHASIFIVEETGFNAALRESIGEAGAEMKRNKHSLQVNDKSIVGKVALDGHPVVVNDVMADPLHKFNPLLPETRAEAAIPLRIGNRTIGVIDIQAKTTGAFSEDEITVLQTVADQVAVAIDNAKSFELSQQAVMEMREIDRLKSQFLANMSHELRTPLNSIIGFSRVIIKGIDGPVTELQQQDLTAIYNSGQHLLGLINDILDLSKIEAGKMELAFDEVNIVDVTSSVLSTMSGLIKDKPIQMKRIIEPNLPTVRADTIRIRQVMINLLSNASKFTDEGDILVEVALKPGPNGRNEMRISVTDTGPGISKQDQTKLFQPFSQVDDSPTRKTGGTGLGLSICQHIVNMHGGRIWIDSDVGRGSTFHFTLPLFRKENELASSDNRTILAIDDDPQVIALYERYLQPQGYQVVPLSDPSLAVERVKQLKPFAVTLDIMMPGIDGWQILDNLKSDPETRDTPIIICSIIDDLEKGFNLGATDYLVKPILEDDIVNALDRLNADGSIREVLVIDDDPDDLRLIGKILTDDGRYKVIFAEGGRVGWDIISSGNPPHAVILDLFMPEMDGFKILENMQASEKLREIPVIVISGMDISAEQKNQLKEFGQRLLSKGSFNEKELLTSIQRSLDRVHTRNK